VSAQPDSTGSEERHLSEFSAAIDRDADVPIGLQLGWALSARIHDGELRPGQRLPGLRELAQESGLNVNTVRAVYQRLEQRGLLESQQGSGTFVASTFRRPSAVGAIAADAAREAEAIGVDPREVAAALYVAMPREDAAAPSSSSSPSPPATAAATTTEGESTDDPGEEASAAGAATRRRALRAQIATLERAIGEIEAEHPGVAPRPSATRRGPGPTLLSAQELEQVRSTLVRRLAQVQSAIDERAAAGAAERAVDAAQKGRQRARARVNARKDNTPLPGGDPPPTPTPSPTSPGRTARPRTAPPRPAAAGT
jgi:DNA-binding transcriptional regulator YhcF (GntR family)